MLAKFERLSGSPGAYRAFGLLNTLIDVRPVLPSDPGADPGAAPQDRCARSRSPTAATSPSRSPARNSSSIRTATMRSGPATARRWPATSRSSSPATAMTRRTRLERVLATVLFTDIVDFHRAAPQGSATRAGAGCSTATTRLAKQMVDKHRGILVEDHRRRHPRHLRRTGARGALRARLRDRIEADSGCRCAPGCTPARSSCAATTSAASRCMPRRG